MYKGTTPTIIFDFPNDFDVTQAEKVLVTISAKGKTLFNLSDESIDVEEHSVSVWLSQKQTLAMPVGEVSAQINLLYADGQRVATNISKIDWQKNLFDEVMA